MPTSPQPWIFSFSTAVILKIRPWSPKSNQFFVMSQLYDHEKFGRHPTNGSQDILGISPGNETFSNFYTLPHNSQWIFTKLSMCIDIVAIWFGIANGQISSIFWQSYLPRIRPYFYFWIITWVNFNVYLHQTWYVHCYCNDIVLDC